HEEQHAEAGPQQVFFTSGKGAAHWVSFPWALKEAVFSLTLGCGMFQLYLLSSWCFWRSSRNWKASWASRASPRMLICSFLVSNSRNTMPLGGMRAVISLSITSG